MVNDPLEEELVKREMAKHADPTIQRALGIIGQQLNPVQVVGPEEMTELYRRFNPGTDPKVVDRRTKTVGAFRAPKAADPRIFVNQQSPTYQAAAKSPKDLIKQLALASQLVHEQVHNTEHGPVGEYAARRLQADWFREQMRKQSAGRKRLAEPVTRDLEMQAQAHERYLKSANGEKR